ncbi:MAG: DUF262 domain-containing protein [Alphaproteobacteria bacterium]|nr:DUF262 domain-containing protein [Alphaproteobacteria bacterium]
MGSGIEAERIEEGPVAINQPFDPEKIEVSTRNMTVQLLLARIKDKAINLKPDFQRRLGIWTDQRQSRLIESLLLKIPLPTLYAAEDKDENWAIVDGIQRLTAIARFVEPEAIEGTRLSLQGLEYLDRDFRDKTFDQLPARLKRRLLETELVVHLIRHGTPEAVKYNIFARINTGGMPLSSQELRHAIIPGPARNILKEWSESPEFKAATADSIKDERMADRELVLRFVAFRLTHFRVYKSYDFDRFLVEAMRTLNTLDDSARQRLHQEFLAAMVTAHGIFGNDAFRKRYRPNEVRYPINKALFEAVSVNIAGLTDQDRETLTLRSNDVKNAFIELMNDKDFDSAISQGTGDIRKVKRRFEGIENLFRTIILAS